MMVYGDCKCIDLQTNTFPNTSSGDKFAEECCTDTWKQSFTFCSTLALVGVASLSVSTDSVLGSFLISWEKQQRSPYTHVPVSCQLRHSLVRYLISIRVFRQLVFLTFGCFVMSYDRSLLPCAKSHLSPYGQNCFSMNVRHNRVLYRLGTECLAGLCSSGSWTKLHWKFGFERIDNFKRLHGLHRDKGRKCGTWHRAPFCTCCVVVSSLVSAHVRHAQTDTAHYTYTGRIATSDIARSCTEHSSVQSFAHVR